MAVSGMPDDHGTCPNCGDTVYYNAAVHGYLHTLGPCRATNNMHRHHTFVDHSDANHDHGACSEHAHFAGGFHPMGTEREVSTPENDPLGWAS